MTDPEREAGRGGGWFSGDGIGAGYGNHTGDNDSLVGPYGDALGDGYDPTGYGAQRGDPPPEVKVASRPRVYAPS